MYKPQHAKQQSSAGRRPFSRLARLVVRRRRIVALLWLLVLVGGGVIGGQVYGKLSTDAGLRKDAESVRAFERLSKLSPAGLNVVALIDGRPVADPGLTAEVWQAVADVRRIPGVVRVVDFYDTKAPALAARDGNASIVQAELDTGIKSATRAKARDAAAARLARIPAPRVVIGGSAMANHEFQLQAESDLRRGEIVALPILLLLLLWIFRGVRAALLPLIVAIVAVSGALMILDGIASLTDVSTYSVNIVTMMGLGLAVDYSLLIVSRYREELANGLERPAAIERTLGTAGRTILFSGLTVAVALTSLLLFAEPFLRALAWGGIGVVLVTLLASLTLLPSLLVMWWGNGIGPAKAVSTERGLFFRLSRVVQRFAPAIVPVVVIGLVLLAVPFAHVRLSNSEVNSLPKSSASRQLFEAVRNRFPGGGTDPVVVVATVDAGSPSWKAFLDQAARLDGVDAVEPRPGIPAGSAVVDLVPQGTAQGPQATRLVQEVRALPAPFVKEVTGSAAFLTDYRRSLAQRLPFALGLMGLASFVLLWLMTGSVVVPIKAVMLNVLSLGASFGALVWVFQEGHLHRLLGFDPVGYVDITNPILILIFAFGLSMDYEVFLLARIKEVWDATGDNDTAVSVGLQRTGRIITSAALLIIVVFLGFAAGQLLTIKEIGLGLALAVFVDATIIRMLLVPSVMKLLGAANWWSPGLLRRLHERFGLAEPVLPPERAPTREPQVVTSA